MTENPKSSGPIFAAQPSVESMSATLLTFNASAAINMVNH
jgi:hypothetical protein